MHVETGGCKNFEIFWSPNVVRGGGHHKILVYRELAALLIGYSYAEFVELDNEGESEEADDEADSCLQASLTLHEKGTDHAVSMSTETEIAVVVRVEDDRFLSEDGRLTDAGLSRRPASALARHSVRLTIKVAL